MYITCCLFSSISNLCGGHFLLFPLNLFPQDMYIELLPLFWQIEARGLPLTSESLASLPPFSPITINSNQANGAVDGKKCKPEVAKTGLGSSAAMTTALVGALLHYLGVVNLPASYGGKQAEMVDSADVDMLHIVAQSAHCIAQGKVGSGFDVSAAVYGSQRYIRFSPEILYSAQVLSLSFSLPHK